MDVIKSNQVKTDFDLSPEQRSQLLGYLMEELEGFYHQTELLKVTPDLDLEKVIDKVRSFDLKSAVEGRKALKSVMESMTEHTVHTPHPMYYGLYNPRANFAGILADVITAFLNPQLAAWSHAPYASEVEKYMVETFGILFGYPGNSVDGVFATGGAEANFTALLCALNHAFPGIGEKGMQSVKNPLVVYCSQETHHSILKGARVAGLGSASVRIIELDSQYKMRADHLEAEIKKDRKTGKVPVMVVATAGTTGTGTIDHLDEIGQICNRHKIWYHVDAAYGGATAVNPEFRQWIHGIEFSQSLIVDLHKWFSVPMATSMFITRNPEILHQTFHIKTGYMPGDARNLQITDQFTHSFQWSRRFSGLKIFISLLLYGLDGYSEVIGHQISIGEKLRELLKADGWSIKNHTPLPVVCFSDDSFREDPDFARTICDKIVRSGEAWISVYPIRKREMLRACITNYNSGEKHVEKLVKLLDQAREEYKA
jgi:glutamate/tyrosine decarboxylase-like PLP-dependent enzyme